MFGVADEGALGDLEDETLQGEVCLLGGGADVFWEREVGELGEGDVDRESEVVGDVFGGDEDCAQELAGEQAVKSGLFGEGNELVWRDKAALRMLPAGESLKAAEQAGAKLDKRLKIRNDLVIFERSAQIVCVVSSHGKRRYYGPSELPSKISRAPASRRGRERLPASVES